MSDRLELTGWDDFRWDETDRALVEEIIGMLEIEEYNISSNATYQPYLIAKAGLILANARSEEEFAKLERDRTRAGCEISIRNDDPKSYGLSKWTELGIASCVKLDDQVKDKESTHVEAQRKSEFARALFTSVYARTSMIDAVVRMKVSSNYVATSDEGDSHYDIKRGRD